MSWIFVVIFVLFLLYVYSTFRYLRYYLKSLQGVITVQMDSIFPIKTLRIEQIKNFNKVISRSFNFRRPYSQGPTSLRSRELRSDEYGGRPFGEGDQVVEQQSWTIALWSRVPAVTCVWADGSSECRLIENMTEAGWSSCWLP